MNTPNLKSLLVFCGGLHQNHMSRMGKIASNPFQGCVAPMSIHLGCNHNRVVSKN